MNFTSISDLSRHTFLDAGCGSGLSSLVAHRLGADRVLSVDVDRHSIDCTKSLRQRYKVSSEHWDVRPGSLLDVDFVRSLGVFSYVYSWGVLHHTGAMWVGLENLVQHTVADGGLLHFALYNRHASSPTWLRIKRLCNRWPRTFKPAFKSALIGYSFARSMIRGTSPLRVVREYRSRRGMDYFRDIDDWISGLPYEYCRPAEVMAVLTPFGAELVQLREVSTRGNNEYLFRCPARRATGNEEPIRQTR